MRYAFDAPTMGTRTASFIGGSLFIIGGIYAFAAMRPYVRVVLIYDSVSNQTRKYLNLVHHIVGLAFAGMLAWPTLLRKKRGLRLGVNSIWNIRLSVKRALSCVVERPDLCRFVSYSYLSVVLHLIQS